MRTAAILGNMVVLTSLIEHSLFQRVAARRCRLIQTEVILRM